MDHYEKAIYVRKRDLELYGQNNQAKLLIEKQFTNTIGKLNSDLLKKYTSAQKNRF